VPASAPSRACIDRSDKIFIARNFPVQRKKKHYLCHGGAWVFPAPLCSASRAGLEPVIATVGAIAANFCWGLFLC
jgi:hypothetical protein